MMFSAIEALEKKNAIGYFVMSQGNLQPLAMGFSIPHNVTIEADSK